MSIAEKFEVIADEVYEKGKEAQRKDFMDKYIDGYDESIAITSAINAYKFAGTGWHDGTFYPSKDLKVGYGYGWFYFNQVTNIKQRLIECGVKFDFSGATDLGMCFEQSNTEELPEIDLTAISRGTGAQRLFYNSPKLRTIDKIITKDIIAYSNNFVKCWELRNVLFEGSIGQSINFKDNALLTTKSIVSIVEHLNNDKTGLTLTLSQTAVSAMTFPFTSEQSGNTYNSWDELIATKSNWTISLV